MAAPITWVLAPLDQGTRNLGGRPGGAAAPHALYDELAERGALPEDGEVTVVPVGNQAETLEADLDALCEVVAGVLERGRMPVVLGGDHGTTYATARGLHRARGRIDRLAYLDVHFDLRPYEPAHTSGSSFRRLVDEGLVAPGDLRPLGIVRPTDRAALKRSSFDELASWAEERSIPWRSLDQVRGSGAAASIQEALGRQGARLFSFDVDVLDEQWAPGVSAPGTGRLSLEEAIEGVRAAAPLCSVFDVVEMVPRLDEEGRTLASVCAVIEAFLDARPTR